MSEPNPDMRAAALRELLEQERGENDRLREALAKINEIRNQIVSSQTVNWSRDIYPLVAALNEAGFELGPGALADLKARIAREEPDDAPIE